MATDLREQLQATLGGAYTLENELGGGGMSRVFAATENSLGRKVVVKVLPPELAEGVSVERFKREILLAAQLQQANIVQVLSAGEINGLPYYTMPLVDGHSLRTRLTKGGPLPVTEAVGILREVARALAYAHDHGVVHRDIKPDNVLLSGGSAMVTDFGVAKALSASKTLAPGGTITQFGTSLGTPAYMAPEQAAADATTNHRADIYAFGVMAYELLAGQPPFHGRTAQKLLAAHMAEKPPSITDVRPDVPPTLAELITKCLEKEPDQRPQSATELTRVLETVTSAGGHPAMPAILLGGRRRLGRALAFYAAAFVAVALVSKAAIAVIGLPEWVFPGALAVMALGLPVILFTAFVQHGTHQALTTASLTPGGSPVVHSTLTRIAVKASPFVSWRRTTIGGLLALSAFVILVLGFMTFRALGIGPAGSLLAAGKIKDRDRLLVTDFHVQGADTTVGSMITEAVRTDLGQSQVISVMPPAAVAEALRRMQKPPTTHVDLPLARDIAAREGVKAIVDGDVAPLGQGFVMAVRLVAADSGTELASFRETADSPRDLLPTLDKLTRKLRGKIGESLRTVHAAPPLEQVTTSSLEALRKYAAGARANDLEGDDDKAIPLLQQAVAIDTTFAMAYRKLGVALGNNGMPQAQTDAALEHAYRYRDRLPARERYLATTSYFDFGPGHDRQKAAAAYEALLEMDSLDHIALNNYGNLLQGRREYARAESLYLRAIRANTEGVQEFQGLIGTQVAQKKFDAADSTLALGRSIFPKNGALAGFDAVIAYGRQRTDSVVTRLAQLRTSPDALARSWATYRTADFDILHGRLSDGERMYAEGFSQDAARGAVPPPLLPDIVPAWIDIWYREQPTRGLQRLDSAMARTPLRSLQPLERPDVMIATMYALGGRPDKARALLAQYVADAKDSAVLRQSELDRHTALGEIALAERRPMDAVTEFKLADRRPDGPAEYCEGCLPVNLGRAYDVAGMPDSTIKMYELYLAGPHILSGGPLKDGQVLAGIYKRLGELYDAKGDRDRAVKNYTAFVDLWKNADAELQPKVQKAKQRLEQLKDVEARTAR
ncbi:MAG TPA: protein kinase [Gemmatimonadaceae bacterium]|nr:protein kinase [Gemmatimonadaceae bacterium]